MGYERELTFMSNIGMQATNIMTNEYQEGGIGMYEVQLFKNGDLAQSVENARQYDLFVEQQKNGTLRIYRQETDDDIFARVKNNILAIREESFEEPNLFDIITETVDQEKMFELELGENSTWFTDMCDIQGYEKLWAITRLYEIYIALDKEVEADELIERFREFVEKGLGRGKSLEQALDDFERLEVGTYFDFDFSSVNDD